MPDRVRSVAAGGGSIWASQFELTETGPYDPAALAIAHIDPASDEVTTIAAFPVFSASWGAEALWALGSGRRGDLLYRIDVEP